MRGPPDTTTLAALSGLDEKLEYLGRRAVLCSRWSSHGVVLPRQRHRLRYGSTAKNCRRNRESGHARCPQAINTDPRKVADVQTV